MRKKICFFTSHYDFPRQWLMEYYENIMPKNIRVFLFCQYKDKEKFTLKKTKIVGYNNKFSVMLELRRFCKKNNIDIVTNLSGKNRTALVMALATLFIKTKNIFYNHANPTKKELLIFLTFQFLVNRVLIGADDLRNKTKKYLLNKNKIFTLPTPINTELFRPKNKKQARKRLKLNNKDKIILYVGRISYLKGSDFLLKIIKKNPDKKFILIGKLKDKSYNVNQLDNIICIPELRREELVNYYNAADLFLFLSRTEGLGAVYREAMASGTPAIVSNIEAVKTVKSAIKIPFNVNKIQEKINWFFDLSPIQKMVLSKTMRQDIIKNHSEKTLKKIHLNYFLFVN